MGQASTSRGKGGPATALGLGGLALFGLAYLPWRWGLQALAAWVRANGVSAPGPTPLWVRADEQGRPVEVRRLGWSRPRAATELPDDADADVRFSDYASRGPHGRVGTTRRFVSSPPGYRTIRCRDGPLLVAYRDEATGRWFEPAGTRRYAQAVLSLLARLGPPVPGFPARLDLVGASLRGAMLVHARLAGADLRSADLREADLRRAGLAGADLWRASLVGANLRGADLTGASLDVARLAGSRLRGARPAAVAAPHADLTVDGPASRRSGAPCG